MTANCHALGTSAIKTDRQGRIGAILLSLALLLAFPIGRTRAGEPDAATRDQWKAMSQLGQGFVVWESNRSGRWRLYRRELDGSNFRQISPDEKGRDHYCPHLSPDGKRLVYLSYPAGSDTYQQQAPDGKVPLILMNSDGSGRKQIADSARGYFEDRGAVWIDNQHLIYIDGDGFTRQMDLRNGKSHKLTKNGLPGGGGFLMNATKTHATSGEPTFSLFNASSSAIPNRNPLGGCQPYFTHDGRWGFWMGGAGGPINRIDLKTRKVAPILRQNDPRMPKDRHYLYFPMVSRDGRMFACAASPNQHDHFKSDYDIFVARMNPGTLELLENPVRYSFHEGTDRFPDVYLEAAKSGGVAKRKSPNPPAAKGEPGSWPANPSGLQFIFQTAKTPNLVPGTQGNPARSYAIHPRGRARLNHDHAMVLTGGAFLVKDADESLLKASKQSHQLTVEAVIRSDHLNQGGPARIVSFSSSALSRNFTLGQERENLIFRLRTPKTGENGYQPEVTLCKIEPGKSLHVAVTYRPGELAAYVDGHEVYRGRRVQGDFSNWEPHHLLFGDEFDGQRDWSGTLEGVAIYNRALDAGEIGQNAQAYHNILHSRKAVPQIQVSAELLAKSPVPTLEEIKPYRSALMVSKYRVTNVARGTLDDKEIFVAHWALLDGNREPVTGWKPGRKVELILEPAEHNPQLQPFVTKDNFDSDADLVKRRYFDARP